MKIDDVRTFKWVWLITQVGLRFETRKHGQPSAAACFFLRISYKIIELCKRVLELNWDRRGRFRFYIYMYDCIEERNKEESGYWDRTQKRSDHKER